MALTATSKDVSIRIKQKKDTEANWESANPILLDGEMILVVTAEGDIRTKIGDGRTFYSELPFNDERLPKITVLDEGKFLRVHNGLWVAEAVPFSVIYTGAEEPVDTFGNDGDLYMQIDSI